MAFQSLTKSVSRVSLEDSEASPEELETLRQWMKGDDPAFDETAELSESFDFDPDEHDERWWAEQTGGGFVDGGSDPTDCAAITVSALEFRGALLDPTPDDLSDDRTDFLSIGSREGGAL